MTPPDPTLADLRWQVGHGRNESGIRMTTDADVQHNHWNEDGDLVIEKKTLFRRVGWRGQTGRFYKGEPKDRRVEPGGYSPVYEQIATWVEGEGWHA